MSIKCCKCKNTIPLLDPRNPGFMYDHDTNEITPITSFLCGKCSDSEMICGELFYG